jgi:methenyltetrahydromethanopterin cyclohydrolase
MGVSVNRLALPLVEEMVRRREELRIDVERMGEGATVIDAGVRAQGGYLAGEFLTEICMGGLGKTGIFSADYGGLTLPTISVFTDLPAISLLGSQFAGWRISVGKYFAMGSGPGRALAQKPRDLYAKINYRDESDVAVIVLEAGERPPPEALELIAEECGVGLERLYVLVAPTSSIAGSVQISGRIAEMGLHKLTDVGFDPKKVISAYGVAPIAPVHPESNRAMGRTNDMLLYGGVTYFTVETDDDMRLRELVDKVPSSTSRDYGRPFADVFKAAGYDFYKIDASLFAPAVITVNNVRTGSTFTAGKISPEILRQSIL